MASVALGGVHAGIETALERGEQIAEWVRLTDEKNNETCARVVTATRSSST
jgi:hypothetical protein